MKRWLRLLLLLLISFFAWHKINFVRAGGGPVEVRLSAVQGYVNNVVKFDVYFHPTKPDEILAQTMYLYLQDPKDGRSCKLYADRTDNTGKVSGECTSSVIGDLKFYIHWMEGGRSSDDSTIAFVAAPPVVKISPSPSPITRKVIATPSPSLLPTIMPSPSCPPTACPSPGCNTATAIQPSSTPVTTPKSSPNQTLTATKTSSDWDIKKWLVITVVSLTVGLGLPIIFFLLTKKS